VPPGETSERDLSWFDTPGLAALSADGRTLLFGDRFGIYLRPTNGDPAMRVPRLFGAFEGAWADDLSPDGNWVLATTRNLDHMILVPTKAGRESQAPRFLPSHDIKSYSGARFFPDGRRILFNGRNEGGKLRSYVTDLDGSAPVALAPSDEDSIALTISPNGRFAAAIGESGGVTLLPLDGGE